VCYETASEIGLRKFNEYTKMLRNGDKAVVMHRIIAEYSVPML